MGILKDFKEFALKGNVVDLAVAVIIGGTFGKVVSSMVEDILMPPLGLLLGNVDFKNLHITIQHGREAVKEGNTLIVPAVQEITLRYGLFLQHIFDFTIVAFCLFLVVKGYHRAMHKKEVVEEVATMSKEEQLLTEIRDLLKDQKRG